MLARSCGSTPRGHSNGGNTPCQSPIKLWVRNTKRVVRHGGQGANTCAHLLPTIVRGIRVRPKPLHHTVGGRRRAFRRLTLERRAQFKARHAASSAVASLQAGRATHKPGGKQPSSAPHARQRSRPSTWWHTHAVGVFQQPVWQASTDNGFQHTRRACSTFCTVRTSV